MAEYNDKQKHYPLRNRKRQQQSNDEQKKIVKKERIDSLTFCIESDEEDHLLKKQKRKGGNQSTSLRNEKIAGSTASLTDDLFSSDSPEIITGNDSFSFNEEMKFGGYYCRANILRFGYNDDAGENSVQKFQTDTKKFWLESPPKEQSNKIGTAYAEQEMSFNLQADGVLTSTLITDLQSPEVNENTLLCNISKIEEILNSSTKTMRNELIQLKEKVARTTVEEKISVPKPKEKILKEGSKIEVLDVQVLSTPLIASNFSDPEITALQNKVSSKVSNIENLDDYDHAIENRVESDMPIGEDIEIENALIDTTLTIQPLIKEKNDYEIVEANLKLQPVTEDDGGEKATEDKIKTLRQNLTEALLPKEGETVSKYMDRTIPMIFDVEFFVDCISWKPEKEEHRLHFETTSNILKCWKDAYQKAFGIDKNEKEFKYQFRRFKMSKRAARKAEEEKKIKNMKK